MSVDSAISAYLHEFEFDPARLERPVPPPLRAAAYVIQEAMLRPAGARIGVYEKRLQSYVEAAHQANPLVSRPLLARMAARNALSIDALSIDMTADEASGLKELLANDYFGLDADFAAKFPTNRSADAADRLPADGEA